MRTKPVPHHWGGHVGWMFAHYSLQRDNDNRLKCIAPTTSILSTAGTCVHWEARALCDNDEKCGNVFPSPSLLPSSLRLEGHRHRESILPFLPLSLLFYLFILLSRKLPKKLINIQHASPARCIQSRALTVHRARLCVHNVCLSAMMATQGCENPLWQCPQGQTGGLGSRN